MLAPLFVAVPGYPIVAACSLLEMTVRFDAGGLRRSCWQPHDLDRQGAIETRIVTAHPLGEKAARVLNAVASSRELALAIRYVSEIVEEEFPAWRRTLHGFPDSYAAWRWYFTHDKAVAGSSGDEVVSITVHPNEYLAHCKANKIDVAMASFRNFAQLKSNRQ